MQYKKRIWNCKQMCGTKKILSSHSGITWNVCDCIKRGEKYAFWTMAFDKSCIPDRLCVCVFMHYSCVTGLHYQKWDAHAHAHIHTGSGVPKWLKYLATWLFFWPFFFAFILLLLWLVLCFCVVSHLAHMDLYLFVCFLMRWRPRRNEKWTSKTIRKTRCITNVVVLFCFSFKFQKQDCILYACT